ncbi:S-adenosylmethionine sensor upstream of mTORC1 isoform X1 [Lates japonicus]|uniref:S-adenosylmethionine sensor upstream of mTORC1 isoform X1 n=1 Tax=Lates japonicus TaxID=270547 RepID=A0AAD3NLK2_LATJO|nr:S-adenosylmethionine sensor upstream of mTORC1 isoform X1 [Lates japonicus]
MLSRPSPPAPQLPSTPAGSAFHAGLAAPPTSSPYQRWICCKKAHQLLELHGLLLIITPDSHQNRHALMMRSWRGQRGESLLCYKYAKHSHMHPIAFSQGSPGHHQPLGVTQLPQMLPIPRTYSNEEEDCAIACRCARV